MKQLLRHGSLPRSMIGFPKLIAGFRVLRSSLTQVHSGFTLTAPEMWQVFRDTGVRLGL